MAKLESAPTESRPGHGHPPAGTSSPGQEAVGVETQLKQTRWWPALEGRGPEDVTAAWLSGQGVALLHQRPAPVTLLREIPPGSLPPSLVLEVRVQTEEEERKDSKKWPPLAFCPAIPQQPFSLSQKKRAAGILGQLLGLVLWQLGTLGE